MKIRMKYFKYLAGIFLSMIILYMNSEAIPVLAADNDENIYDRIDGYLSEYIPDATDGDKITIIQLLNHTSGLGEHQNLENYKIVSKQDVHLYANVNYSLPGKVIEAVSGGVFGAKCRLRECGADSC